MMFRLAPLPELSPTSFAKRFAKCLATRFSKRLVTRLPAAAGALSLAALLVAPLAPQRALAQQEPTQLTPTRPPPGPKPPPAPKPPRAAKPSGGKAPIIPGGNSKAPVSIDAGRLDYLDKEQKLIYTGNVIAKQGDATLKSPKVTLFLTKDAARGGADSDGVRRMEADGPVVVTSKDQVGTGDRGVYDKTENKVYLIGNPVLTRCSDITRGGPDSTLIYDLATGRAWISGGRVKAIFTPKGGDGKSGKGDKGC